MSHPARPCPCCHAPLDLAAADFRGVQEGATPAEALALHNCACGTTVATPVQELLQSDRPPAPFALPGESVWGTL